MVNSGTYKLGPSDGQLVVKIDPDGIGKGMAHALTLEVKDWSADKDKADIKKNTEKTVKGATATFKSKKVSGDEKKATVSGDLSAGGSSTSATMNLQLTDTKASGTMSVSHSSLGIKPYSAPLGVIKVKDNVTVEFEAKLPS